MQGTLKLEHATIPIISQNECETYYKSCNITVHSREICAGYVEGGASSFIGDGGGPLVCYQGMICLTSYFCTSSISNFLLYLLKNVSKSANKSFLKKKDGYSWEYSIGYSTLWSWVSNPVQIVTNLTFLQELLITSIGLICIYIEYFK